MAGRVLRELVRVLKSLKMAGFRAFESYIGL